MASRRRPLHPHGPSAARREGLEAPGAPHEGPQPAPDPGPESTAQEIWVERGRAPGPLLQAWRQRAWDGAGRGERTARRGFPTPPSAELLFTTPHKTSADNPAIFHARVEPEGSWRRNGGRQPKGDVGSGLIAAQQGAPRPARGLSGESVPVTVPGR